MSERNLPSHHTLVRCITFIRIQNPSRGFSPSVAVSRSNGAITSYDVGSYKRDRATREWPGKMIFDGNACKFGYCRCLWHALPFASDLPRLSQPPSLSPPLHGRPLKDTHLPQETLSSLIAFTHRVDTVASDCFRLP